MLRKNDKNERVDVPTNEFDEMRAQAEGEEEPRREYYDRYRERLGQEPEAEEYVAPEGEKQAAKPKMMNAPGKLTKQEIDERVLTHLTYKAWCPRCVKRRRRAELSSNNNPVA